MPTYWITAEYPTQGPIAHEWGVPDEHLDAVLDAAHLTAVAYDAGTVLATGDRDVQVAVEAADLATVTAALSGLPEAERALWTVTEADTASTEEGN